MRKISIDAAKAFAENKNFNRANTMVCTNNFCGRETSLYLHGNLIAQKKGKKLFVQNCGFFTKTTKERLNALGLDITQRNFKWFLRGREWNGQRCNPFSLRTIKSK